jgi:hypothetical protein
MYMDGPSRRYGLQFYRLRYKVTENHQYGLVLDPESKQISSFQEGKCQEVAEYLFWSENRMALNVGYRVAVRFLLAEQTLLANLL